MAPIATTPTPAASPRLPGAWRLDAARAVTLRPKEDGILRIAHGQVWVTLDGPHHGHANDWGDRVLAAGEQLRVRAGQRLVLESSERTLPAWFSWDFEPRPEPVPALQTLLQPWAELRLALGQVVGASWRLVRALVLLGAGALLLRPRRAPA